MKFAMTEKFYEKYLKDVVLEVSQDGLWRERLFAARYNKPFLLTYKELEEVPCSLWTTFSQYGLEFFVSKVNGCPEEFAEGLIVFKFEAKGFPHLVGYSGNNQNKTVPSEHY